MAQSKPGTNKTERDSRELLIVDCGVDDADQLIGSLARPVDVVRLEEGADPILQIAGALSSRFGTETLHIAAHGEPGVLFLAGRRVDSAYLCARRDALSTIKFALRENASLFLWSSKAGCGLKGEAFTQVLAGCTGTTVCAPKPAERDLLSHDITAERMQEPCSLLHRAGSMLDLKDKPQTYSGKNQESAEPSKWASKLYAPSSLAKPIRTPVIGQRQQNEIKTNG